jgi:hypothetical protein
VGAMNSKISPRGRTWDEVRKELYTAEEIRESDLRVAIISERIKARNEKNISQREENAVIVPLGKEG